MAIFSRVKTWVSNEVLTASDLNAEFNNLLTNTKPESIEDYSVDVTTMRSAVDPGGVGTEQQATSLAGEIERLRFTIKRLVGAQWYSDPGRYLTAGNLGVQTADIAANAVTTAKINNGAITYEKRASINISKSSSCSNFTMFGTSVADVTNLSVSFTTYGKPVFITLESDGDTGVFGGYAGAISTLASANAYFYIVRDSTEIARTQVTTSLAGSGASKSIFVPVGGLFQHADEVSAGTYTYKIQCNVSDPSVTLYLQYAKLVVREL